MSKQKSDFVHLHVHSEYSLLDGLGRIDDLVGEAAKLGQPALALTDHGAMHGVIEFFRTCKAKDIKPIIGVEAYMTQWGRRMADRDPNKDRVRHHLLLLAQNQTGYQNLLKINSAAQLEGYYYRPRIDADFLAAHSEGLICTSGCMAAEVPFYLNEEGNLPPDEKLALERLHWYLDVFGRDRFYIELQEHTIPQLTKINRTLVSWAQKYEVGLVVTNDVHYARAADASPHDTLLCVQTSSLVSEANRMKLSDQGYYLKSEADMRELFRPFADLPESAFTNTVKIADMCQVDLEDGEYHLPHLPPDIMPPEMDYRAFLRHLTEEGLIWRYGERADDEVIQARKELELGIISQMNFDVYFLIVWDMCKYARENNIWWNVRGSGAGSIVAYALGVTMIDPLVNNLIFERFLNPGRNDVPDFDLDFPDDRREDMIRYTIEKYGEDQVAQIVSFGRMKARAAIRDVGRAQGVELDQVDRLAKLVPAIPGKPVKIKDVLDPTHEFYASDLENRYQSETMVQSLIDTAQQLEGVARHASVHAAAVILADKPLVNYVPLMRPQGSVITKAVTQFEFPICESIGLLKVDFLGLSTLTIMRKAAELIKERHGETYTLDTIPIEDPKAFDLLASGNVTGIFQVEGAGMRRILSQMRPNKFEHIIAVLALYRPGPLQYIPNFIARMHGEEEVTYRHPMLEPILSETYGIIVYQEQIMRIATDMAGYTPSEADFMRKAVAKKKEKDLLLHKDKMVQGGLERGIEKQVMLDIFSDIEYFARYGFNKAHAADYAVITCQTAYLKAHYPVEYMTALLTVERNNTDKIGQLLDECRAMHIKVLPPNVNKSGSDFIIDDSVGGKAIRFGLGAVKNVGDGPIEAILEGRGDEPFNNVDEFCQRVDLRKVGRRALESLIKVGALEDFGERAVILAIIERMTRLSATTHQAADVGQISLFDMGTVDVPVTGSILDPMPEVEQFRQRVILGWEKELVGTYVSAHPLDSKMAEIRAAVTCLCGDLEGLRHERHVRVAGLINKVRHTTTKKGDSMAFIEIEDTQGSLEVIVFPRTFAAYQHLLSEENLILISGKVDAKEEGRPKILADTISTEITLHRPLEEQGYANGNGNDHLYDMSEAQESYSEAESEVVDQPEAPPAWVNVPRPLLFVLPRGNNLQTDQQTLQDVFGLLKAHPGSSRFELCIPQNEVGVLVEYEMGILYDATLKHKLTNLGVNIVE